MRVLFCNVGWMSKYQGQNGIDRLYGGGANVDITGVGDEACNFFIFKGKVYGSFKAPGEKLNIKRLGAKDGETKIENVLVVWTAKSPQGSTVVIGWYKKATVYATYQKFENAPEVQRWNGIEGYWIRAEAEDVVLLSERSRHIRVPRMTRGGMGRSNVWYADKAQSYDFVQSIVKVVSQPVLSDDVLIKSENDFLFSMKLELPEFSVNTEFLSLSQKDLLEDPRNIPIWFATNREVECSSGNTFTNRFSDETSYGRLIVNVPRGHKPAELGSSWWIRIQKGDDRLSIVSTKLSDEKKFWDNLKERMQFFKEGTEKNQSLLFLHGYNVTFEEAALRTAQLSYDPRIAPACFFSWPSGGAFTDYAADESVIEASTDAIRDFIEKAVNCAHDASSTLHIIGHSMGNRGLIRALVEIYQNILPMEPVIENIVFAAPDVDARVFKQSMAKMKNIAKRRTLYASGKDKAVRVSRNIHKFERAGFLPPVTISDGLDTVDASGVEETFLGHSYVANVRALLTDLSSMLKWGADPGSRVGMEKVADEEGRPYWRLT